MDSDDFAAKTTKVIATKSCILVSIEIDQVISVLRRHLTYAGPGAVISASGLFVHLDQARILQNEMDLKNMKKTQALLEQTLVWTTAHAERQHRAAQNFQNAQVKLFSTILIFVKATKKCKGSFRNIDAG